MPNVSKHAAWVEWNELLAITLITIAIHKTNTVIKQNWNESNKAADYSTCYLLSLTLRDIHERKKKRKRI